MVAVGTEALRNNTGANNTALGRSALYSNTTANLNTAVGYQAGYSNTTGTDLTLVGYTAGYSNTTGAYNTFLGRTSGYYTTTGSANVGVGYWALVNNSSGGNNTAIGMKALQDNTTANYNTAVGVEALNQNTTSNGNVALGYQAGYNNTGTFSTYLGYGSGYLITTGSKNTILGCFTGNQGGVDIRTSSNNIVLSDGDGNPRMYYLQGSLTWFSPVIRDKTTASAANMRIDATSGAMFRSTSSLRYKNTVNDATHGLTELLSLRPVTYKGNNDGDTIFGGLIAEEVHDAGLTEFVQYDDENRPDALAYGNMVSLCIKAIQEQQETITALEARIAALESN